jgi:cysteinyl-tRNA synthetase
MNKDEQFNNSLVSLLKIFKNRPYHLSKYLIENNAFNSDFINRLVKSDKLRKISESENASNKSYFANISQMNQFYNSFVDDIDQISEKSIEELTKDLNKKLDEFVKLEKFELASKIRDYMLKNGIKRLK